jgi:pentatricopeptide repeat protein
VFVDAACWGLLLESYATHDREARVEAAQSAFELMVQRHAEAAEQQDEERAQLLWVSDAARSTYLKFMQRTQPDRTPLLWGSMTRHQKEGNPRAFVAALNALSRSESSADAEALVAEYDALRVPWSVQTFNAWLGCYEMRGEWEAAEAAWSRLPSLGIAPSAVSYRKLMQVLIADGSYDQLAKIEPLYQQMTGVGKDGADATHRPLRFSSHDYAMIIKTALRCGLGAEAHKWAQRARTEGLL